MIYDCFMFFNELEVLEIRLNELNDIVDQFVIVEATKTHSNKNKPLYFDENKGAFKDFSEKIVHIIVDDYPEFEDAWTYEKFQRNQIAQALQTCEPEDIIIISDVDEIPRHQAILEAAQTPGIKILEQKMYYYYLNMINYKQPIWLLGSRVLRKKEFLKPASEIRRTKGPIIKNGGWHFSYLGGVDRIITKIESFAHQEFNLDSIKKELKVEQLIQNGKDILGRKSRKFKYKPLPIDHSFPKYLIENQDKFQNLIKEPEPFSLIEKIKHLF